ncbi:MAG: amino acid ABC transporter permease [Betaproteobacteria bacterium]|jgi:His/Glu/Gln/Arg/opine family amino acid ABC transporter permease subunit|nr:amino acid ABC transporter permease [Betaproteobacteria bacterium]
MSSRILTIAVIAALLTSGCSSNYSWGWFVISPWTPKGQTNLMFLVSGLGWTVLLAVCAILVSVTTGLLVSLLSFAKNRGLRAIGRMYVEAFRSIPMLVMVLWVYYGLPVVLGIELGVFAAGVVALALCDSAFEAEIFRAGIQSIDRGQHEASESIGLTWFDKMRYVILPQAIRRILPPLGNQFVYMLKTSSLVSIIGLTELTRKANELVVTEYRPLEIYTFLILEYLVLIVIVSFLFRKLEQRMSVSDRRPG